MKKIYSVFVVALSLLISFSAFSQGTAKKMFTEKQLPDITIKDLSGKSVNISDYGKNGKITIINFWATWCSPCKKELTNIADLYEDWQSEYDVELVAVSIDDTRNMSKVNTTVNGKGWEYDILLDSNQKLKQALNFQTIPYTVVVDKDGNIVFSHTGYVEGDEYILEDHIKEL